MAKRGLPTDIKMRHDSHYVEEFVKTHRTIGKIIPINLIEPNPEQPRVEIGDLSDLTSSIKQNGVLEPLLVKPIRETGHWMIIAGERRWRAANLAGLREVPCIEFDVDAQSIAEIALIENLQRKDLTIWEEADGLAALAKSYGYTHDEIAKKISKSRTTVTESMTIAGIPTQIREKCREANINAKSTLLEIARQFDDAEMLLFVQKLAHLNLNREELKKSSKLKTRPNTIQTEVSKNRNKVAAEIKNIFTYKSKNESFTLEIKFKSTIAFDKKDILQSLKETFDSVKANGN